MRSLANKLVCVYAGAVLPVICFTLTLDSGLLDPVWQSGQPSAYAKLALAAPATLYLFPLSIFAIVCLLLVLAWPQAADRFPVRLGVYSGVLLSVHFSIVESIVLHEPKSFGNPRWMIHTFLALIVVTIVSRFGPALLRWLCRPLRGLRNLPASVAVLLIVLVLILLVSVMIGGDRPFRRWISAPMAVFVIGSLALAPALAFAAYVSLSLQVACGRGGRFRPSEVIGALAWLAAYLATARASVVRALDAYAQLPLSAPGNDCYVASAAARGHPRFVGSFSIRSSAGTLCVVNRQLCVLKAGELALKAVLPRCHRWLRRGYDVVGPAVAARCTSSLWRADLAYLSLKPAEWFARVLLRMGLDSHDLDVVRVYGRSLEWRP